jgi:mono/diheme cytochrome c family protein
VGEWAGFSVFLVVSAMKYKKLLISSALAGVGTGLAILAGGQLVLSDGAAAADAAADEGDPKVKLAESYARFQGDILPLMETYCYDCHGDGASKGDLELDKHKEDYAGMVKDYSMWKVVLQHVESKTMPPAKKDQPSQVERDLLVEWIGRDVFRYDCEKPDPGRVTIRRLNRAEYNNTIRDLVWVDFQAGEEFPADDSGYGFDNNGDVLSLSPMVFEKYVNTAERVMVSAIRVEDPPMAKTKVAGDKLEGGGAYGGGRVLASHGDVWVDYEFPAKGRYRITAEMGESPAGDEHSKAALKVDDKELKMVEVKQQFENPGPYDLEVELDKGKRRVAVQFLNDFYDPKARDQNRRDRNLFVESIQIEGPLDAVVPPSNFHQNYVGDFSVEESIRKFANVAYRRPATDEEVTKLVKLAMTEKDSGTYARERGIKLAFTAIISSPSFLFRGEAQPNPDNPAGNHLIDEYALASRLSYFLWSSQPDGELLQLAKDGKLRENLAPQVKRMLGDWKAKALTENFAGQWLQLKNLDLVFPNERRFKGFDGAIKYDMKRETEALFSHIVKEDKSVLEFLSADYTFLTERLAKYYDIEGVKGNDELQLVSLKGQRRGGVLTHGSILTLTSNPTRTSPVKRGKWVLENLLGTPPPEAPPNVPALEEPKRGEKRETTLRESLEQHRSDPNCASCHALMDPIGFALENFDGTGKWREKDGDDAIDSSGELVSGETFANSEELRQILLTNKGDDFVRCLADRLLTYALGRGLEFYDRCALKEITQEAKSGDYRFSVLVMAVVESVPFQYRRGEGERVYD